MYMPPPGAQHDLRQAEQLSQARIADAERIAAQRMAGRESLPRSRPLRRWFRRLTGRGRVAG